MHVPLRAEQLSMHLQICSCARTPAGAGSLRPLQIAKPRVHHNTHHLAASTTEALSIIPAMTAAGFPSCRLLLAVALLLLCAAATTTQGQGEPIKPRTRFISYAAPPGPNPECLRAKVPPFCRGKSAITARRSPAEPVPVVRRTPAPTELQAMAAAVAAQAPALAAGPLCFVYSNGRRLCVPTE